MAITRWNPMRELEELTQRLNHIFDSSLSTRSGGQEVIALPDWQPNVDVLETTEGFLVQAELPQVKKEDVEVSVDRGTLRIRGERKQEKEEKNKRFHRVERSYGSFMRSFSLPDNVDAENVKAEMKDGLLSVRLVKAAQKPASTQSIPVK